VSTVCWDPVCRKFFHKSCHLYYHAAAQMNTLVPPNRNLNVDLGWRECPRCIVKYSDPSKLCQPVQANSRRGRKRAPPADQPPPNEESAS
jgi:hypothetical protein